MTRGVIVDDQICESNISKRYDASSPASPAGSPSGSDKRLGPTELGRRERTDPAAPDALAGRSI